MIFQPDLFSGAFRRAILSHISDGDKLLVKHLEKTQFSELAERVSALYNEEEDALLLGMLGQDYVIRHNGIFLHGQKAPDAHAAVILEYLFSRGTDLIMTPWRSIGDFTGTPQPDFRKRAEQPLAQYVGEILTRTGSLLPLIDAVQSQSIIGSDLAMTVRALPKVYLHLELSQETRDFPAEVWILFSRNADDFLSTRGLGMLAEIFKDRVISILRIY